MFGSERITQHYTRQLALCSALLTLSSGFAQTQAMDPFIRQFGEYNAKTKTYAIPAYFLSFMNSLVFIGFAVGIYIGSVISARYGRRMTVFCMSLWALCSAIIIITATTKEQMLISRILNYLYIGMELSVIPVFQSEIMPAPVRGFAVGSYQMSIGLGGLIINSVCRGTSTLTTNAAWRIPMGLYYIVPTIVASSVWFIPESPRFLLSKGRVEEAEVSLRRLRVDKSGSAIDTEVESILLSLEAEKDNGTYYDLVKGTNLRRTLIVMGTNFFLQATGQSFSSSYGTVFIKSLGTVNAFTMAAVNTSLNAVGSFIGMILVDKVGRRPILCIGSFLQGTVLLIMGGVGSIGTQTPQTKSAVVAMTTLFGFTFSTGWAPLNYIITSEMGEQKLRDKTQRVGSWVNVLTNFVVAFTLPYLLNAPYAALGAKVGFIFGPIAITACIWAFLCVPECRNRSLEEIDLLFHYKVSAISSSRWVAPPVIQELSNVAHGEGKEIEEEKA